MKIIILSVIWLGLIGTAQAFPAAPPDAESWVIYRAPCSSGDVTLGASFCLASLHGSGQTAPTVIPLIPLDASAGGTWAGTTATCGTPPAENPAVQGSGFTEKVAAVLDTPSEAWVEGSNYTVGVSAFNGDPAFGGIAKVTFWLCGNTQAATLSLNSRTNLFDYNLNIASTDQHNGDAYLYVYATPVNGYERRLGPFHFVLNNSGVATLINHTHWYLDPVGGTDPTLITQCTSYGNASPTPTPAHLFKHLNWAIYCAAVENSSLGGGIVHVRAGTDYEDNLTTPNSNQITFNQRTVTVQPDTGVADGAFKISLTCRNGAATISGGAVTACATTTASTWNERIWKIWFKGTTFDTGQITTINCGGVNCFWTASDNSAFTDSFGPGGPMVATSGDGDPLASAGGTSNGYHLVQASNFTFATFNQRYSVIDSTVSNYVFAGAQLLRNVVASVSFDFSSMQGPISCSHAAAPRCGNAAGATTDISDNSNNSGVFKTTATQPGPFKASHVPVNSTSVFGGGSCTVNGVSTVCVGLVTVGSIAANTPSAGQYTISWSGSPGIDVKTGQPNEWLEMTSGTCAGYSKRFVMVSETASATVISQGSSPCSPASIAPGDTGFTWLLAHPDCGQVIGQLRASNVIEPNPNLENVIFQQYQCTGASMQELFPQVGPQNITFTGPSTMSVSGTTIRSDTLTAASVSGSTVTWTGTPTLLTTQTGSGYSPRYKISGGPLTGQIFTVSSQSNAAHTTTFNTSVSNLCGGGACSGVTANATLETIAGNFFHVVSATSQYEYALVTSTPTSSLDDTTATLAAPFITSPLNGATVSLVRSIKDWMIVSSFISSGDTQGQIQNGQQHFAMIQSTFWTLTSAVNAMLWRSAGNFATQTTSIFDSVFRQVTIDPGPTGFPGPSGGGNFSNNVAQEGTLPTGATIVGGLTIGTDGKPTGSTLNGHTLGHTPIFPRSLSDQVLTSSSLVGAQQP